MRFAPRVFELANAPALCELLPRLAGERGLVLLDSASGSPRRFSLLGFDPLRGIATPASIEELRACVARVERVPGDAIPGPFHGGFFGALSYDLGPSGERGVRLRRDPWGSPLVVGGWYGDFFVRDEQLARTWLVLADEPGDGRASVDERRSALLARIAALPAPLAGLATRGPLVRHVRAEEHCARVERLRESIAAGDLYQANLAQRFTRVVEGDPIAWYLCLRERNPAPYMAYLAWDEELAAGAQGLVRGALLSASPELLLECDARTARTRPIKGTIRRSADPLEDRELVRTLLASEKDRAELAMIVDLERNDLGRVARAGSVIAEGFPRLESYASVHHLVADIACELAPGQDGLDVLAALFPGGSISGAPKLASLAAIAREEGEGRGFFSGSLGFLDTRGQAAFNILIRTLVWRPGEISFHAGGGITWSSDALAEERECLLKAERLIATLDSAPELCASEHVP